MSATGRPDSPGIYGPPSMGRRMVLSWVLHPAWDLAAFLVPAAWWFVDAVVVKSPVLLTLAPTDVRRALAQIAATVSGTLAGFVLTSVSILINLLRTPMSDLDKLIDADDKRRVGAVFLAVLPMLAIAFVSGLVAIARDSSALPGRPWIQLAVIGSLIAALSGIARIVWVMRRLLTVTNSGAGA